MFGSLRDRISGRPASPQIRSLAVLPLDNFSQDPGQDYFADGMTEVLTDDLSQINGLRVISRTSAMSYRQSEESLPQIARELNVDAVVVGSVLSSGRPRLSLWRGGSGMRTSSTAHWRSVRSRALKSGIRLLQTSCCVSCSNRGCVLETAKAC
jgi:hypothetical protein